MCREHLDFGKNREIRDEIEVKTFFFFFFLREHPDYFFFREHPKIYFFANCLYITEVAISFRFNFFLNWGHFLKSLGTTDLYHLSHPSDRFCTNFINDLLKHFVVILKLGSCNVRDIIISAVK